MPNTVSTAIPTSSLVSSCSSSSSVSSGDPYENTDTNFRGWARYEQRSDGSMVYIDSGYGPMPNLKPKTLVDIYKRKKNIKIVGLVDFCKKYYKKGEK